MWVNRIKGIYWECGKGEIWVLWIISFIWEVLGWLVMKGIKFIVLKKRKW